MTADCGWFWGSRSWSRMQMKRTRKNRLDYRNLSTGTSIWDPHKRQCLISWWRVKEYIWITDAWRLTLRIFIFCSLAVLSPPCRTTWVACCEKVGTLRALSFTSRIDHCDWVTNLVLWCFSGAIRAIEIAGAHSQVNFWKSLRKAHLPHYKLQDLLEEIERMYGKDHAGNSLETTVNCGLMQLESSNQICTATHCVA